MFQCNNAFTILVILLMLCFFSCQEKKQKQTKREQYITYFEGDTVVHQIITFDITIRDGISLSYYNNGNVQKAVNYEQGQLEGNAFYFSEDGSIESRIIYVNGKKNGLAIGYYSSGNLRYKMNYRMDIPIGTALEYNDSSCNPKVIIKYNEKGEIIKREETSKYFSIYTSLKKILQ